MAGPNLAVLSYRGFVPCSKRGCGRPEWAPSPFPPCPRPCFSADRLIADERPSFRAALRLVVAFADRTAGAAFKSLQHGLQLGA